MASSNKTDRDGEHRPGDHRSDVEKQSGQPVLREPGPRERILQAALELFVEQGYFNTNVPDISKRSRCSVGSIYHHFLNKEEIASRLYEQGIKQFRDALSGAIDAERSLEQNITSIVVTFLTFAEEHLLLSRYLWLARHNEYLSADVRHPTVVGLDELGRKLTKAVKNGMRSGEIPPMKAEVFWSIVFGLPLSFMRDWLDGYTKTSPREIAPTLARGSWAALQGVR